MKGQTGTRSGFSRLSSASIRFRVSALAHRGQAIPAGENPFAIGAGCEDLTLAGANLGAQDLDLLCNLRSDLRPVRLEGVALAAA